MPRRNESQGKNCDEFNLNQYKLKLKAIEVNVKPPCI